MIKQTTITLMQAMADLTAPACAGHGPGACKAPRSCCSAEYCDLAQDIASAHGVLLVPELGWATTPKQLKFMSATGCTVPPHWRPMCTLHTCAMNGLGTFGDKALDAKYFALRDQCMQTMLEDNLL